MSASRLRNRRAQHEGPSMTGDAVPAGDAADALDAPETFKVWLLDVGPDEYGDAVLCKFGNKTILIDGAHPADAEGKGGHPSIPDQLGKLLDQEPPYRVSLLIVSHAHQDHIGCLPKLVQDDLLRPDWALIVDPELGWGGPAAKTVTPLSRTTVSACSPRRFERKFALIALTMKRWSASWSTRLRSKIVTTVCWIHLRRGERGSSVTGAIVAWR